MTSIRLLITVGLACIAAPRVSTMAASAEPPGVPAAAEQNEFFERRVRPVLVEHCQKCHGEKKQEAGLRFDSRAAVLKGSENGPVVALGADGLGGDPAASKLLTAINYADENLQMPPDGKLPGEAIEALTHWVKLGAPWPEATGGAAPAADPAAWKRHWAFQAVRDQPLPVLKRNDWAKSPVDSFILAQLEQAGLAPAEPADRRTLLRRATFDLVGLPPTADEIDAFVSDPAEDAFATAVERLLASPHYGERWGRYWLDYARYADTKGYVFMEDRKYPFAYKYRDWVVRALNEDLPYDQFLIQQIAADRLPTGADPGTLAALGFLTVGRRFLNAQPDIIDDRLDVLCRTTLGLTVTCARCHDHKFDPISAKDYYSLYGVFASTVETKDPPELMAMADAPQPFNVRVFVRGNPHNQGDEAPRRFLPCLAGENPQPFTEGSGRLELARAIASRENPLTARVMVNRVWLHLFGAGLVRTPSDFGLRSEPPTHPELLDYLARRFMDEGWSLKKLHRLILLSSTYQQSSQSAGGAEQPDPENRLLAHMSRRRLDLEALRDSLLSVSGALDHTLGGPGVELTTQPFTHRRTIYGLVERQNLPGIFRTFDFAGPDTHSPQRFVTTVPQQALFLMNSPLVSEQAKLLAAAGNIQSAAAPPERVERLYRRVLGRAPTAEESQLALEFVATEAGRTPAIVVWRYGYGEWDGGAGHLKSFSELPHWAGSQWQAGPAIPDPQLAWLHLTAEGGHPATSLAAVRRWTAPCDGAVTIEGTLEHPDKNGNGVEAFVGSSRHGAVGHWIAEHNQADTRMARVEVSRGDTLDFVVAARADDGYDGFRWNFRLRLLDKPANPAALGQQAWDSRVDFHGPLPTPVDPWARLAQVLLLTNEFVFID
jgi:hypothetical protein